MVSLRRLTKSYGAVLAVDDLNLDVQAGEVFALLGPNGAGKTTVLRMIITILRPTAGEVRIAGIDVAAEPERARQMFGYVPQERAVDRSLTAREHLQLFGDLYHLSPREARTRAESLLSLMDLSGRADQTVGKFSGGMKKRLEIACGLMHRPRLLVLDEPTLGLDVEGRARIWDLIRRMRSDGITILLSTNYLDEADQLCDRVAILDGGRLRAVGSPAELKASLRGDLITITLLGAEGIEGLAQDLRGLDPVQSVEVEGRSVRLKVPPKENLLPTLMERVTRRGLPVESIHYARPSLEEVFLHYTGHRIREESVK